MQGPPSSGAVVLRRVTGRCLPARDTDGHACYRALSSRWTPSWSLRAFRSSFDVGVDCEKKPHLSFFAFVCKGVVGLLWLRVKPLLRFTVGAAYSLYLVFDGVVEVHALTLGLGGLFWKICASTLEKVGTQFQGVGMRPGVQCVLWWYGQSALEHLHEALRRSPSSPSPCWYAAGRASRRAWTAVCFLGSVHEALTRANQQSDCRTAVVLVWPYTRTSQNPVSKARTNNKERTTNRRPSLNCHFLHGYLL